MIDESTETGLKGMFLLLVKLLGNRLLSIQTLYDFVVS